MSSRFLGSSSFQQFFRVVGDYSSYHPIGREVVFSWRLRGGAIFAPTVDVATQSGNFIPPEQRFYGGGPNDVRGFDRNELGPVVYVVPVLVPVLLAPFVTGEDWGATPLGGAVLVVSLLVVSVGAGLVSSSSHVSRAAEGGPPVAPVGAERHT